MVVVVVVVVVVVAAIVVVAQKACTFSQISSKKSNPKIFGSFLLIPISPKARMKQEFSLRFGKKSHFDSQKTAFRFYKVAKKESVHLRSFPQINPVINR